MSASPERISVRFVLGEARGYSFAGDAARGGEPPNVYGLDGVAAERPGGLVSYAWIRTSTAAHQELECEIECAGEDGVDRVEHACC